MLDNYLVTLPEEGGDCMDVSPNSDKMKKIYNLFFTLFLAVFAFQSIYSQPSYFNDIQKFKKLDSMSFPPPNAVLLVGSSSFTKWTDVQSYFPGYDIINRGFGGSTLPDVIRYAYDIIVPYKPAKVVVYCGDNDLVSDSVTAQTVVSRFKALFYIVRGEVPAANIAFVSIKPSPKRERLMDKMKHANSQIKKFLKRQKNADFIDVFKPMLLTNGKAKPDLFLEDSLHMNKKGYDIWQKAIQPYLEKK